ncbi:hypothetical protein CPC08DRAFT_638884 [Agrocybe pediades]|nr:hypothetical protein CPC08DRAFT_638884 [Agrocybe pediades]
MDAEAPPLSPTKPASSARHPPTRRPSDPSSSTSTGTGTGLPNLKASNFLHVSQVNSLVKGSWIIDPTITIPPSFLRPLDIGSGETEETRKSLVLESQNGAVDGDIYIMPTSEADRDKLRAEGRRKIYLYATSRNGNVSARFHDAVSSDNTARRLPLYVHCGTRNGNAVVHVPRSFEGPINVRLQNGNVRFSSGLEPSVTTLSSVNGVRRNFLGDFSAASKAENVEGEQWLGDELHVESRNGNVKICYDDEVDTSMAGRFKPLNLFGKLFNF